MEFDCLPAADLDASLPHAQHASFAILPKLRNLSFPPQRAHLLPCEYHLQLNLGALPYHPGVSTQVGGFGGSGSESQKSGLGLLCSAHMVFSIHEI